MDSICIFGDSITWGASDIEKGGWANRLRYYFDNQDTENDVVVYSLGIRGDTTTKLLERVDVECEARKPIIIIFAIGINDSKYTQTEESVATRIEQFRNNLEELTKIARRYTEKIIFIGLTRVDETKTKPTGWDSSVFYSNQNIEVYERVIQKFCSENSLALIDVSGAVTVEDVEEDGLHPDSAGHEKIFIAVRDFLVQNKWI